MGIMLTIGILATLICSMIVLPALLAQIERRDRRLKQLLHEAATGKAL